MKRLGTLAAVLVLSGAMAGPDTPPAPVSPAVPIDVTTAVDGLTLRIQAPANRIEAGQTLLVRVSAEGSTGDRLTIVRPQETLGAFDVRTMRDGSREPGASGPASPQTAVLILELTTYEAGAVELPPLEILWTDAAGTEHTAATEPVSVEVTSLIGETFDRAQFKDIKPEVEIALGIDWWWWAVAGAVLTAAGLVFWRRRLGSAEVIVAPPLPAEEWARLELDRLAADGLPARGSFHDYWVRLSGVLREYIDRRFEIAAPDRTTKEFLEEVRAHPDFDDDRRRTLAAFLRCADRVKFAAEVPQGAECDRGMSVAREFVHQTSPIAAAASPTEATS